MISFSIMNESHITLLFLHQSQADFFVYLSILPYLDLHNSLESKLFGQHLVTRAVIKQLKGHLTRKTPSKALALSFHGGTGTGKNHVSKIIAYAIFRNGLKSKYVHLISATKEFPHAEMLPIYKEKYSELYF